MIKNRLVLLLKSLSKEEFRWLYKFVQSPYYNVNQHIVKLYELLRKYYPGFDHPKLSSEQLFSKLFPKESYDVQRIRLLFHRFANLVESFLVAQQIKNDDILYKKTLTQSLGRTNTYDLFEKKTKELLDDLDISPIRDEEYYKNNMDLNLELYSHPATNRQKGGTENILEAMKNLDNYFELSKVKLACALGSRQKILSIEGGKVKYLDVVLDRSDESNLLLRIYSKILMLQESDDSIEVFENLKDLYTSNLERLSQKDKRSLLALLLNFCTRFINKGVNKFMRYSLDLYKVGLIDEFLLNEDKISEVTFTNIVSSGIVNKEYEWTQSFIEKYGEYLDDTIREDAITYSWAILFFYQKEFDQTIQLISNYTFKKVLQNILAKTILIRVYVEQFWEDENYFDFLLSMLETFEKYIRNNKTVPEAVKPGYLNFIRFVRRLVNLKFQKKELNELETKLRNTKEVSLKGWLLTKIKN